jgi:hypothetical protein
VKKSKVFGCLFLSVFLAFTGCTLTDYSHADVYKVLSVEYPLTVRADTFEITVKSQNISGKKLKRQTDSSDYKTGVRVSVFTVSEENRYTLFIGGGASATDVIEEVIEADETIEYTWLINRAAYFVNGVLNETPEKAPSGYYSVLLSTGEVYTEVIEIL